MASRAEYGNEVKGSIFRAQDLKHVNRTEPNGDPDAFSMVPDDSLVTITGVDDTSIRYQWESPNEVGSGGRDRSGVLHDSEGRVAAVVTVLLPDDELRIRPAGTTVDKQAEIQRVANAAQQRKMMPWLLWGGLALAVGGGVWWFARSR